MNAGCWWELPGNVGDGVAIDGLDPFRGQRHCYHSICDVGQIKLEAVLEEPAFVLADLAPRGFGHVLHLRVGDHRYSNASAAKSVEGGM